MNDSRTRSLEVLLATARGDLASLLAEVDAITGGPPQPDEACTHLHGSKRGWTWNPAPKWRVQVPIDGDDSDWVYFSHPHCWSGDVVAMSVADARAVAGALHAAARRAEDVAAGVVFLNAGRYCTEGDD